MEKNVQPQNLVANSEFPEASAQKQFSVPLIIGVVVAVSALTGLGGYYLGMQRNNQKATLSDSGKEIAVASLSPTSEDAVCTMDAKLCPDGSSVGRVGPTCEFAPCPVAEGDAYPPEQSERYVEMQQYKSSQFTYSFDYPSNWELSRTANENGELLVLLEKGKNIMELSAAKIPSEGLTEFVQNRFKGYEQNSFTQNPQYNPKSPFSPSGLPSQQITYTSPDGTEYIELFTQVQENYFIRITVSDGLAYNPIFGSLILK